MVEIYTQYQTGMAPFCGPPGQMALWLKRRVSPGELKFTRILLR